MSCCWHSNDGWHCWLIVTFCHHTNFFQQKQNLIFWLLMINDEITLWNLKSEICDTFRNILSMLHLTFNYLFSDERNYLLYIQNLSGDFLTRLCCNRKQNKLIHWYFLLMHAQCRFLCVCVVCAPTQLCDSTQTQIPMHWRLGTCIHAKDVRCFLLTNGKWKTTTHHIVSLLRYTTAFNRQFTAIRWRFLFVPRRLLSIIFRRFLRFVMHDH